jgi:hypothetical protein
MAAEYDPFSALQSELGPLFQAIINEAEGGGVGVLEHPDQIDREAMDLPTLIREEISGKSAMPEVVLITETDEGVERRRMVNKMLMILAGSTDMDDAMRHYRLLRDEAPFTRRAVTSIFRSDPKSLYLSDKEYRELAEKYFGI